MPRIGPDTCAPDDRTLVERLAAGPVEIDPRRRTPRLRVNGELVIRFAMGSEPITLHDISFQGFSIWSPTPVTQGELRLFWLGPPGADEHLVYAVAAHVAPWPPLGGRGQFSGWHAQSLVCQQVLAAAVEVLTESLTFDE